MVLTISAWGQWAVALAGFSTDAMGVAATTMTRENGTSMRTDQVSSADVI